jgi:hypothetical protein
MLLSPRSHDPVPSRRIRKRLDLAYSKWTQIEKSLRQTGDVIDAKPFGEADVFDSRFAVAV